MAIDASPYFGSVNCPLIWQASHYILNLMSQIARFMGSNIGPIWVLSVPDGPHVGAINLAIRDQFLLGADWWYTGFGFMDNMHQAQFSVIIPYYYTVIATCFHPIDAYLNTLIINALEELIDDNVACILWLFYLCFRIKSEMIGNIWLWCIIALQWYGIT